jgi:hypothetical protein
VFDEMGFDLDVWHQHQNQVRKRPFSSGISAHRFLPKIIAHVLANW